MCDWVRLLPELDEIDAGEMAKTHNQKGLGLGTVEWI